MNVQSIVKGFLDRIENRTAKIGVVGLGYVGLPLVLRFSDEGFQVTGFDIDETKVEALNQGRSYISHIRPEAIKQASGAGFVATSDMGRVAELDAVIICVPTPLNKNREPDLSMVLGTVESILPHIKQGQLIVLESTTYPGTTEEQLAPLLESQGFVVGKEIFLAFSPEREDPANPNYTTQTIPKVVGGVTPSCLAVAEAMYRVIVNTVVPVSSPRAAEMTKLLENIHRAVNIGLVNEMKIVADKMGIDIYEVIQAAATKPFGFVPYYPGPGLGGHCIPIDPFYLTWKAREYGVNTRFIELAGEVNSTMPQWVFGKLVDALNQRRKPVNGSKVLVLGIAYKKNVDDMRESPAVVLMEMLRDQGARVSYSDPYVPRFPKMREHKFDLESIELTQDVLKQFDCVLLATAHDNVDYDLVQQHSKLVIDTRGVYRERFDNIVRA